VLEDVTPRSYLGNARLPLEMVCRRSRADAECLRLDPQGGEHVCGLRHRARLGDGGLTDLVAAGRQVRMTGEGHEPGVLGGRGDLPRLRDERRGRRSGLGPASPCAALDLPEIADVDAG